MVGGRKVEGREKGGDELVEEVGGSGGHVEWR